MAITEAKLAVKTKKSIRERLSQTKGLINMKDNRDFGELEWNNAIKPLLSFHTVGFHCLNSIKNHCLKCFPKLRCRKKIASRLTSISLDVCCR